MTIRIPYKNLSYINKKMIFNKKHGSTLIAQLAKTYKKNQIFVIMYTSDKIPYEPIIIEDKPNVELVITIDNNFYDEILQYNVNSPYLKEDYVTHNTKILMNMEYLRKFCFEKLLCNFIEAI